jgi:hypothetical protein
MAIRLDHNDDHNENRSNSHWTTTMLEAHVRPISLALRHKEESCMHAPYFLASLRDAGKCQHFTSTPTFCSGNYQHNILVTLFSRASNIPVELYICNNLQKKISNLICVGYFLQVRQSPPEEQAN